MPKVTSRIVHERVTHGSIELGELMQLIAEAVAKEAGVDPKSPDVVAKVTFSDVTEGSPPYRVGVRASVVFTENLAAIEAKKPARRRVAAAPLLDEAEA